MNPTEQYIHVMYIIPPLSQGGNLKKNTLSLSYTEVTLLRKETRKIPCYLGNVLVVTDDGVVKRSQSEMKYNQLRSLYYYQYVSPLFSLSLRQRVIVNHKPECNCYISRIKVSKETVTWISTPKLLCCVLVQDT